MTWTDDRTDACVEMWNSGLSAGVIAFRLGGVTRNAVIGKIHRLSADRATAHRINRKPVSRRSSAPRLLCDLRRRRKKPRTKGLVSPPKIAEAPLPPEPPTPDKLVSLAELEPNQCRYPFGDPKTAEFGFCGCPVAPGSSYCPGHLRLCTNDVQPAVRKRTSLFVARETMIHKVDRDLEAIG